MEYTRVSGSQGWFTRGYWFARPFDWVLLTYYHCFTEFDLCFTEFDLCLTSVLLSLVSVLLNYGPVLLNYGPVSLPVLHTRRGTQMCLVSKGKRCR